MELLGIKSKFEDDIGFYTLMDFSRVLEDSNFTDVIKKLYSNNIYILKPNSNQVF